MLTRPVKRLDHRGRHTEDAADRFAPIVEEALAPTIAEGLSEGVELAGAPRAPPQDGVGARE